MRGPQQRRVRSVTRATHTHDRRSRRTEQRARTTPSRPAGRMQNGMDASPERDTLPLRRLNVRCHLEPHAGSKHLAAPPGLTQYEVSPIEAAPVWPAESACALPSEH